jgi:hypothetical protein
MNFVEGTNPMLSEIMKPLSSIVTASSDVNSDKAYQMMKGIFH